MSATDTNNDMSATDTVCLQQTQTNNDMSATDTNSDMHNDAHTHTKTSLVSKGCLAQMVLSTVNLSTQGDTLTDTLTW